MKLIVAPADEDAVADRQNARSRLGELVRPDFLAGLQRERHDSAVFERKVEAIASRRRRSAQRRPEILLPEDFAVGGTYREERTRFGLRDQPSRLPMQ